MIYSPKLKKAMTDIKSILAKYDIAALVVLHDYAESGNGFGEYYIKLDPGYSVAKIEGNGMVRFRAKLDEDYKGDIKARNHRLAATANMLDILATKSAELSLGTIKLSERFGELINVEHGKGTDTSQQEIDN